MSENKRRILEMLAQNKISVDEATRLLSLVDQPEARHSEAPSNGSQTGQPKYLRVTVVPMREGEEADRVNIRVPMSLLRAGIKLTSLIPPKAADQVNTALRDKGLDFDLRSLKTEDMESLIEALGDLQVDVESGKEKVRVYVE